MSYVSFGTLQRAVVFSHEIRDLTNILTLNENRLKLAFSNLKGAENKAKIFSNLLASEASLETFFSSKFLANSKSAQEIEVMVFCNDTHIKQLFAELPVIIEKIVDSESYALEIAKNEILLQIIVELCTECLAIFHSRKLRLLERLTITMLLADSHRQNVTDPSIKTLIEVLSQRDQCLLACSYAARKTFKHMFILHKQAESRQYDFEYFVGRIFKRLPPHVLSILQLLVNDDPTNQAKTYRRLLVLFLKSLMRRYMKHLDKLWCFNGFEHCTLFDKNKARMVLDNFSQYLDPENSSLSFKVSQIFMQRFRSSSLQMDYPGSSISNSTSIFPYVLLSIPKEKVLELVKFLLAHNQLFPISLAKSIIDNIGFYYVKTLDIFLKTRDFRSSDSDLPNSLVDTLFKVESSSIDTFNFRASLLVNLQETNHFPDSKFDKILNHLYLIPKYSTYEGLRLDKHVTEEVFTALQSHLSFLRNQLVSISVIMNQINVMKQRMENWTNFDTMAQISIISRYLFPIFKTRPLEVWLKFKATHEQGILHYLKLLKGKKVQVLKKSTMYDENYQIREKGVDYVEVTRFKDFLYFVCKRNVLYSAVRNPQLETDLMEVLDEFYDEIYEIASHLDLAKRFGVGTPLFQTTIQEYIFNEFLFYLHRTSSILAGLISVPNTEEIQTASPLPEEPYKALLCCCEQPEKLSKFLKYQRLSNTCSYSDLKLFFQKFTNRIIKFADRMLNLSSPSFDVV